MTTFFQDLEHFNDADIQAAFNRNDPQELQMLSISVALAADAATAEAVCIRLCCHGHNKVRGNATASLGYLTRRFRMLDERSVKPVIEAALRDDDEYVRASAKSAADEIHQFLHWDIAGHIYG